MTAIAWSPQTLYWMIRALRLWDTFKLRESVLSQEQIWLCSETLWECAGSSQSLEGVYTHNTFPCLEIHFVIKATQNSNFQKKQKAVMTFTLMIVTVYFTD